MTIKCLSLGPSKGTDNPLKQGQQEKQILVPVTKVPGSRWREACLQMFNCPVLSQGSEDGGQTDAYAWHSAALLGKSLLKVTKETPGLCVTLTPFPFSQCRRLSDATAMAGEEAHRM